MNKVDIGGKGTMELSGGVLRLHWKPGVTVEVDDANATVSAVVTLGQGARLPMLVDIQGVKHSVGARRIFPAPSSVSRMALLGSSPVDEVVAMFRLGLVPSQFPVRYFTSSQEALAWLLDAP